MPFYEYECRDCGRKWSALLGMRERDEMEKTLPCPECGSQGPRRLISGFAANTGASRDGALPPGCDGGGG